MADRRQMVVVGQHNHHRQVEHNHHRQVEQHSLDHKLVAMRLVRLISTRRQAIQRVVQQLVEQ